MTSRRNFLKKASLVSGVGTIWTQSAPAFAADLKSQFLIPSSTFYLNTATLGSSPLPVIQKIEQSIRQLEKDPAGENWGELGRQMEHVRSKIAGLIGAEKDEIILTRNTTEGLNLISSALSDPFKTRSPEYEILTSNMEHGGAEVGLEYLSNKSGAQIRKMDLPVQPEEEGHFAELILNQLTSKTRVLLLSHVNTITGAVVPFHLLSEVCRKRGIFLIADGAQSVGQVTVDVKQMGVDAFAASGHKWLLGPKETGFLYINKEKANQIRPLFMNDGPAAYTRATGTRNAAMIIGLGEAIDWNTQIGIKSIRENGLRYRSQLWDVLKKFSSCSLISPQSERLSCNILSFSLQNHRNDEVAAKLRQQNILVKVLPQKNAIRISFAPYNGEPDVLALTNALRKIIG